MPPGSFKPGTNPGAAAADRLRDWEKGSGGLVGPDGLQDPFIGASLADFISKVRECVGGPYLAWDAGGDGRHNQSVAEVLSNGESCSGLFVFTFLALGLEPPFSGTFDAKTALEASGAEAFDASTEYPIGTFLLATGAPEGHMAMVYAPGNQLVQALHLDGISDSHDVAETLTFGPDVQFELAGQFASLGSARTLGSTTSQLGDWASWIAEGIANGLLRVLKAVYAYVILRPLDFAGGFWWELTRRFLNYLKANQVGGDAWTLPGADATDEEISAQEEPGEGVAFSTEDKNRIYFLLFIFVTAYLAFGRDKDGTHYFDKVAGGAGDLFNRDLWGRRTYNNRAKVRARVHHVTVARRRAKTTSRRQRVPGERVAEGSNERTRNTGATKRRTPTRDPNTGKFRKGRDSTPKETPQDAERQGEAARRENIEGTPRRET